MLAIFLTAIFEEITQFFVSSIHLDTRKSSQNGMTLFELSNSKLEFSEKSRKKLSFPTFPFDLFRASSKNDLRERELLRKRFADSCIT